MTAPIAVALATGFVGSLHCAAMCGPLAVAGSAGRRGAQYLAGRLVSYAAIGALLGAAGQHALCRLPADRVGLIAVALVAVFAAWKAIASLRVPRPPAPIRLGPRDPSLLARAYAHLPRRGFALGLATGILPCGMLLPAWTLAMGAGDAAGGALVMAAFCAGSAPGLIAPMLAGRISLFSRLPRWAQAAAWGTLAVWIAARPLLGAVHHH